MNNNDGTSKLVGLRHLSLIGFCLLSAATGCNSRTSETASATNDALLSSSDLALIGSWKTDCENLDPRSDVSQIESLDISDTALIYTLIGYKGNNCQTERDSNALVLHLSGINSSRTEGTSYALGVLTTAMGMLVKQTYTPHDGCAAGMNTSRLCGFQDWQDEVGKDITNPQCPGLDMYSPAHPAKIYLLRTDDSSLNFGESSGFHRVI